jgi:hypothetical protein
MMDNLLRKFIGHVEAFLSGRESLDTVREFQVRLVWDDRIDSNSQLHDLVWGFEGLFDEYTSGLLTFDELRKGLDEIISRVRVHGSPATNHFVLTVNLEVPYKVLAPSRGEASTSYAPLRFRAGGGLPLTATVISGGTATISQPSQFRQTGPRYLVPA